ncbi:putative Rhs element Vgr protein [Vibrio phage 150E35-1]|nr:putative Rhs element Vgr protein [Vibrio phage 150E35-1]
MPLFSPAYHLKKERPIESRYFLGVVVENNDPLMLGRVKVTIQGRLAGSTSLLPWITRHAATGLGGGSELSSMLVPVIGSELSISFENGIYAGQYLGYWMTQTTTQPLFHEDYPNTYGFRDNTGTYWKVNMTSKVTEFHHESGSSITFNHDGDITWSSVRDTIQNIGRNLVQNVEGDQTVTVKGARSSTISGDDADTVSGSKTTTVSGSLDQTSTGATTIKGSVVNIN